MLNEEQTEQKIPYTYKPVISKVVPKFTKNKTDFDVAHKKYMIRVISARRQTEEHLKKLNPNYSIIYLNQV